MCVVADVAEQVGRLDEVVAGVEVAVVLQGQGVPQVSEKMQRVEGRSHHEARAASNI